VLLVLILPICTLIFHLTSRHLKISVGLIFGLVLINIVFELLRTLYALNGDAAKYPDQYDMWCALQITSAVIVCALPCFGGLLKVRCCMRRRPNMSLVEIVQVDVESTDSPKDSREKMGEKEQGEFV
jgi:hypothetical protein